MSPIAVLEHTEEVISCRVSIPKALEISSGLEMTESVTWFS